MFRVLARNPLRARKNRPLGRFFGRLVIGCTIVSGIIAGGIIIGGITAGCIVIDGITADGIIIDGIIIGWEPINTGCVDSKNYCRVVDC